MNVLVLRPLTAADLDAVLRLEQELFGAEAWSRQMVEGELALVPECRYYLAAEIGGQLAGYAGLLTAGPEADVVNLGVATEHWGEGIGTTLLRELLAEAARRGCTEVFLEVRADNARAQRLYARHGFEAVGIRRGYYQPSGTDAVVMRLDLAGSLEAAR